MIEGEMEMKVSAEWHWRVWSKVSLAVGSGCWEVCLVERQVIIYRV